MMTSLDDVLSSASSAPTAGSDAGAMTREFRKETKDVIKSMDADRGVIRNTPEPKPPEMIPEPKQQDYATDPMKNFGSGAMWLATLGPLLTRRPLVNALNASAGVMTAANQKDAAAYKNAFDNWKASTDNAWKMADWTQTHYKDVLDKYKDDSESANREISALASSFNDPGMEHMNKLASAQKAYADRDIAIQKLKDAKEFQSAVESGARLADAKIRTEQGREPTEEEQHANMLQAHSEALGAWGKGGAKNADVTDAKYESWKSQPENVISADAYASRGDITGLVRGRGKEAEEQFAMIKKLAAERHPDMNPTKASISYAEAKREGLAVAARSAPAKIAVQEMERLSGPMVDAIKKLDPTMFPDLNALKNAAEKKLGGPDVVKAAIAVQEFKTAFTNLMIRNGVSTDQARSKVDDLMDKNFPLDQVEAVRDQAKISAAAVIDALDDVKSSIGTDRKTPVPAATAGAPPLGTFKEGHTTTYDDGSKWKLVNGVPTEVK